MNKRSKTVQIRISENERQMINKMYAKIDGFNLSDFVRTKLKEFYEENEIAVNNGIGSFMIS